MLTPARSRQSRQSGLSLVELMVGLAVGLFVVAGGAALVGSQLSDNRRLLLETQIHQDLRSSIDIITRELRRAGHWSVAEQGVWSTTAAAGKNPYADVSVPSAAEVAFRYRRKEGEEGPFGFTVDNYAIKTLLGGAGWQELTDPRTVRITAFSVAEVDAPSVVLPCPKLCADGTQACWPQLVSRVLQVSITGQAVSDPSVIRSLSTNVRVRNNLVKFNIPGSPSQMCPA